MPILCSLKHSNNLHRKNPVFNRWQYWKTYGGRCLDTLHQVFVCQNIRYRWLTFESHTLQTLIHRKHPHRIELAYIHGLIYAAKQQPGSQCLLGLGGGGVIHALAQHREQPCIAIESNATVIHYAHQYFMLERLKSLTIEQTEAQFFLKTTAKRFDHIMVDLFHAHHFPPSCNDEAFILACLKCLDSNGTLAINFADLHSQEQLMNAMIRHCWPNLVWIKIPKTINIIGLSMPRVFSVLQKDKRIRQLMWDDHYGYIAELRP